MKRWTRIPAAAAVAAVLVMAAWFAALPPANAAPVSGGTRPTVTLVTGDQVVLLGNERISVQPGPGREKTLFLTRRVAGHVQVIPADAMQLLHNGQLDPRLFDVTELSRAKRHDAVPVIIAYTDASARSTGKAAAAKTGAQPERDLPAAHGFSAKVANADLGRFWTGYTTGNLGTAGRPKLWLDGVRHVALDVSVPMIGGPAARAAGLDGSGVKVAVLDSGIDATHPDLAGRVVAEQNFTEGYEDNRDLVGHGTHVASTIAGTGAASSGRYAGVAPGAQLLDGKVCVVDGCNESWILAGMQWAAEQGAQIVNLSLGSYDTPGLDPIEQAVQDLTAQQNILFVVAAGNTGPGAGTVTSPASADAALAVGAVDKGDQLADFSSRGPRAGDGGVKPDLTAPGVDIVAARSKDASEGTPIGESYLRMSGTSMATPHVTGAAAALKQQHPQWTPAQLKSALMASSKLNAGQDVYAQGAGRVNLARAIAQQVYATPPSASFGLQRWPHSDDQPGTITVTYANEGPQPVTLSLALNTTAPGGMFTLSTSSVTVPAGGRADVGLTADTRVGTADGTFTGYLTATGSSVEVRVPFAVEREAESYDLTLVHTGRDGNPSTLFNTLVMGLDGDVFEGVSGNSTTTVRLPKGRYTIDSSIVDADSATQLVQPVLDLIGGPQTVDLDARLGEPVHITLGDRAAIPVTAELTTRDHVYGGITNIGGFFAPSFDRLYSARIGPDSTGPGPVTTVVGGRWAHPGPNGSLLDSPETYVLYWFGTGHMGSGFERTVTKADLAQVRLDFGSTVPGVESWSDASASTPSGEINLVGYGVPLRAPFNRVTYHNPGTLWSGEFMEDDLTGLELLTAPATTYKAGKRYDQTWNRAVFGPAFGIIHRDPDDTIFVFPALYGDGLGRSGTSFSSQERITLTRNGADVPGRESEGGMLYTVPAGASTYKLSVVADRGAPGTLSTHTEVAWTFGSARVAARTPLPLSVVRFNPPVDRFSTAPAGATFKVPVTTAQTPDSSATASTSLAVQFSYDGGATWKAASLHRENGGTVAVLKHPAGPGFVSLRATSTDTNGNTVEQTVLRAYKIA
ncbi:S8 family peptidase [Dactylosporangium darangshiense]|uniref:S8 family peptidase n=1 Tax=Dactylosporangium darangshiense TaxID=579108 RepID=UPI0031E90BBA